jgi:hypothetical protein
MLARYKRVCCAGDGRQLNQYRIRCWRPFNAPAQLCCIPACFWQAIRWQRKLDALMEIVLQCAREIVKMLVFTQITRDVGIIRQAV